MTADARRAVGLFLVGVAVVLALVGWKAWSDETNRAEREAGVEQFRVALDEGRVTDADPDPDRAAPAAMWAVAAVLFLAGVIVVVSVPAQLHSVSDETS